MTKRFIWIITFLIILTQCSVSQDKLQLVDYDQITPGAARMDSYLPLLENKTVAVVANQSSLVNNMHLVDTLLKLHINVQYIFCPEHGFRGTADAGQEVSDGRDPITGLPIISLYGSHRKPTAEDMAGIDVVLFDLQDVGTRFYTYISTMTYVMEACAENGKSVIILDRPNPNGYFVDGPVMEEKHSSFVGLHPVPVVYGMTIGEYASMVVGEQWINNSDNLTMEVIPLKGYNRNMIVKLPIAPSPNLPDWQAVYLYPSLCFFEGTIMSVGRGTDVPFQVYGHPDFFIGSFLFTPQSRKGALKPKYMGQHCYGINLQGYADNFKRNKPEINLRWLIGSYEILGGQKDFFNSYMVKLAGTDSLQQQIEKGMNEKEIRHSWQPAIDKFMKIRQKYLMYD